MVKCGSELNLLWSPEINTSSRTYWREKSLPIIFDWGSASLLSWDFNKTQQSEQTIPPQSALLMLSRLRLSPLASAELVSRAMQSQRWSELQIAHLCTNTVFQSVSYFQFHIFVRLFHVRFLKCFWKESLMFTKAVLYVFLFAWSLINVILWNIITIKKLIQSAQEILKTVVLLNIFVNMMIFSPQDSFINRKFKRTAFFFQNRNHLLHIMY